MKQSILHIDELSIGYGKGKRSHIVHRDLTARLYRGELVCLLGENGSGKSTLIRTICGFQPALSGMASMNGNNLLQLTEKELALLASVVLTDRVVVPNATVEELVGLGRSPHTGALGILDDEDRAIIGLSMEKCRILHKRKDPLSSLSDGEKQKAFIAKALAQDTPLIILDEPTAFLDLPARVEIIQLLRSIASSSDRSVLMSTHDLDLALQMADRLWLLAPGENLLEGSPEDLLLHNKFQGLFKSRGIEFDNRSGLFRVEYDYKADLRVEGQGFEYVLLKRAFARKGIRVKQAARKLKNLLEPGEGKPLPKNRNTPFLLKIEGEKDKTFSLLHKGEQLFSESSIEKTVSQCLQHLQAND
ncbi:MAG: iron ABC transporter ATP-binding protein [Bacteroidetes bacterium]|nr:MAG: iron ABC transporter ATP-binding protein [Bacteroidota bacterium]